VDSNLISYAEPKLWTIGTDMQQADVNAEKGKEEYLPANYTMPAAHYLFIDLERMKC